ncbi:vasoactive intestinal polypeptide receptor 1-like [Agrilus planipennis]|uniref:Vasoactive intestinal polypeptide receptor 1-like n=1 Tax=Agrilus planipennis TaxID=224129 RepID=A0A1W4XF26_AGRPL|nr:vasoactive intestinal polypeptide receptor 1-like [Agrilus planipennis]
MLGERDIREKECYSNVSNITHPPSRDDGLYCDRYFDGLLCWDFTKAGTVAAQHCPIGLSKEFATLRCEEDGQWYFSSEHNKTWTNLTACQYQPLDEETAAIPLDFIIPVPSDLLESYQIWLKIIKRVSWVGYGISLVALILSMAIFALIKKLRCPRNRLHMHLFMSFIMRAIMFLLKDLSFVKGIAFQRDIVSINGRESIKEHNFWLCKAFTSAQWYFSIANCVMVLMEGIYLHNLMFLSVLSDNSRITIYYLSGWGLPFLFVIPWSILRATFEDKMCWTTNENEYLRLLIEIPQAASIIINFILFVIIVRILFLKLGSMFIQQRSVRYRRLARSTLILIPLFGVPYVVSLIMGYAIPSNSSLEIIWLVLDQFLTTFQGFFIALIYCLLNGEVHSEIKKFYAIKRRQKFRRSRERTISSNTQCTVFSPLNDDINQENGDCKSYLYASNEPKEINNLKYESLLLTENDLKNTEGTEDCRNKCSKF